MCSSDHLLARIELLREKMVKVALEHGFTNKESVSLSQELDRLLNLYQNTSKSQEEQEK